MGKYPLSINGTVAVSRYAKGIGCTLLLASVLHDGHALALQTPASEQQEQRRRSQAEALERQLQLQAPKVDLQSAIPAEAADTLALPAESPCFPIQQLILDVPRQLSPAIQSAGASALPHDPFRFAQDYLRRYAGVCISQEGLNLIVGRLTGLILRQGYSATRIGIPTQDFSTGVLTLALIPGTIRAIRFADPTLYGTWRSAFPTGPGRLLNVYDLEQGLEQMKRVPSQDVDMHIVPAEDLGASDVVLTVKRSKPWKLTGTFDDSGANSTGKLQAGLNLAIDNPLGLNDLFNIGINTDADRKAGQRGTGGRNLYYAVPIGYWNYALSASEYTYHQRIAGNHQEFVSSGKSSNLEFKVSQLFQRDQTQKNSWQLKVGKRWNKAYFDADEIQAHRRNTTFVELGWVHTHYFGNAQLDVTLANRWGSSLFGGMRNPDGRPADYPTFMYTMQSIDVTLLVPFRIDSQALTYSATLRGQNTRSPLYETDQFTLGGRYTVRGFDGELTLAGERGFYLRNALDLPLADSGQTAYVALDVGKVYGPTVQYLLGDKLAGAAVGVRGGYQGFTYDLFAGWSLYKPEQFKTATSALGFNLTYQY